MASDSGWGHGMRREEGRRGAGLVQCGRLGYACSSMTMTKTRRSWHHFSIQSSSNPWGAQLNDKDRRVNGVEPFDEAQMPMTSSLMFAARRPPIQNRMIS